MARLDRRELTRVRGEQIGFVFQSFMLLSKLSALENVEIPMMYQGVGRGNEDDGRRECLK